jgi:hypothetical protein
MHGGNVSPAPGGLGASGPARLTRAGEVTAPLRLGEVLDRVAKHRARHARAVLARPSSLMQKLWK